MIMWVRPPDRPGPGNSWPDLAIRDGDWKLILDGAGAPAYLFNLAEDYYEIDNRLADEPAVLPRLLAAFAAVLLAGAAVALSAARFASHRFDASALLRFITTR